MKKIITFLLMSSVSMFLVACGSGQEGNNSVVENDMTTSTQFQIEGTEAVTENESKTEVQTEVTETQSTKATGEENNTLVVYFSNTGKTRAIAESIANGLGADIYEIIAANPYTSADLNYNDNNSRSTIEMNDATVRPEILGQVDNMEQYDIIYIGYPIWWGEAPRILATFVESYDFTGKTVIPFCTSASSGVGSSASRLEELAGSGEWMSGRRFSGSESQETIMDWVNGLW